MSVPPQELMRRISAKSHASEPTSSTPKQRFRDLMKAARVEDKLKKKDDEDEVSEAQATPSLPFLLPPIPVSEQEKEKAAGLMALCALSAHSFASDPALSMMASAPNVSLAPGIEALFEKMASAMIVMCSSGETETTLFLDNPSSVFFGSKITIREFSTAPKAFNIEIASAPAAIALIEAGKQDLLSAFQNGKFNFSVHRLDSHIQSEDRPVLHRKESGDQDPQDQKKGREQ